METSGNSPVRLARVLLCALLALLTAEAASAKVHLAAHRGGRVGAPENTVPNFLLALGWGIEISETDAWLSADGVPVLHHDRSLCRTTDIGDFPGYDCAVAANNPLGRFPEIGDFDLAFLKTLDAGSWWDPMYAGLPLSTLEEALLALQDQGMPLMVEVKDVPQAPAHKQILEDNGIDPSNLMLWFRFPNRAVAFRAELPEVRRIVGAYNPATITDEQLDEHAALGDFGISISSLSLTQDVVDRVHARGLFIYPLASSSGGLDKFQLMEMGVDSLDVKDAEKWANIAADLHCNDGLDNDADGLVDIWGYDVDFDGVLDFDPDPGCEAVLAESEEPACSDGLDNDLDTFIDFPADPGCQSAASPIEDPECDDGIDNDFDFFVDSLDPECVEPWVISEGDPPECGDGLDNDLDGLIDFGPGPGNDPGCHDAFQDFEDPQCDDGVDNDADTFIDLLDPSCTQAWVDDEFSECNDGVDNDGDTFIDSEDPGCDDPSDLTESGEPDTDLDGLPDALDNCILVANPQQIDSDGDLCGNACDADYDGSGIVGLPDFNAIRSGMFSTAGDPEYSPDFDHDGNEIIGISDFNTLRNLFGTVPGPSGTTPGTPACP